MTIYYKLLLACKSCSNIVNTISKRKKHIYKYPKRVNDEVLIAPGCSPSLDDELLNSLKGKLIYNCLASRKNLATRWRIRNATIENNKAKSERPSVPISLRYKYGDSVYDFEEYRTAILGEDGLEQQVEDKDESTDESVILPYSIAQKVEVQCDEAEVEECSDIQKRKRNCNYQQDVDPRNVIGKRWMSDYEVYEEEAVGDSETIEMPESIYGTPDPSVLPSKIPCGGCGARLHCQNSAFPGYLPRELFLKCSDKELKRVTCQRCTFLKNYNVALSVTVDQDSYPNLLASLKNKNALIILMVDMTDFPCSIWPNMLDVIGHDKPIILVGNKIDLIPGDSPGWLEHAKKVLRKSLPRSANVLATKLISAKTGFAVEELVSALFNKHKIEGDVYIIGCTNVGKSSLFNDLIQSDFCSAQASDLIQRATVSPWPGTTLNLLKFPIHRISAWQAFLRVSRMKAEVQAQRQARQLENLQAKENNAQPRRLPEIIGHISRSFTKTLGHEEAEKVFKEEFEMPKITKEFLRTDDRKVFNENRKEFRDSKWCFDTPGVVHPDQIINLLTTEELSKLFSSKTMYPRFYSVYPGQTLFIAGLARIDLVHCDHRICRFIIYSSDVLPITMCPTEYADEVYSTLLGTVYMGIPCGSMKRLQQWPILKSTRDFEMRGEGHGTISSEIVLSSAGWAAFTCYYGKNFVIRPWTPEGRGIHLREIPLLRYSYLQRRRRIISTPTYFVKHAI